MNHIGIKLPSWGATGVHPAVVREVAEAADAAGFGSVWVSDHLALPAAGDTFAPGTTFLDALTTLSWAAACTRSVQLATGVLVAPLRDPVPLAVQLATLDVLSGGRAVLGVGSGWLAEEFALLGRDFAGRGRATDRLLTTLRDCWGPDPVPLPTGPACVGPKPLRGRVPVVVGGHSSAALRRAAAHGDAWYSSGLGPAEFAVARDRLHAAGGGHLAAGAKAPTGGPEALAASVEGYRAAGADFVVVELPAERLGPGAATDAVREAATALGLGAQPPTPLHARPVPAP